MALDMFPYVRLASLIVFSFLVASSSAFSQESFQDQLKLYDRDDIHSIHKKLYQKEGRHEFGLGVGGILSGAKYALLTANYQYHFFENAGVEAALGGFGFQFGDNEKLTFYQASLTFSPLYGKVSLFTWAVMNFDIYILGGGGIVNYAGKTDGTSFMANIGLGQRFFINEWLSFKVEYRDYIFSRKNPSGSVGKESVVHNHAITGGIAVMIPFTQRY
jgi:outer membrane beta-barrel protein